MNLVVLNRMNSSQKEERAANSKMYRDWSSIPIMNSNHCNSVLTTLPLTYESAKQIVTLVVQPIASGIGAINPTSPSVLTDEREVGWSMEVIGFGLNLGLSTNEHDTIRDCVHVYCEWLTALLPQPKTCVPVPLLKLPNQYARRIFSQLFQIFIPRPTDESKSSENQINRQAVLCHRVLRTIQLVVTQSTIIDQDTWDSLLLLLLTINDVLLAPPTIKNDIGDQLCERVLSVLLEIWLHACAKSFPSPRMWKTLTELAQSWRHRPSLIKQWNAITSLLTCRLLGELFGPAHLPGNSKSPNSKVEEDLMIAVPDGLTGQVLAQTWYRLLHCIGNPVQLSRPSVISQTYKFIQFTIVNSQLNDPCQHPCLSSLPDIFVDAMKGIARLVDSFLRVHHTSTGVDHHHNAGYQRLAAAIQSNSKQSAQSQSIPFESADSTLSSMAKARCNSLLHLFGTWLFEAALIDCTHDIGKTATTATPSESSSGGSSTTTLNLNHLMTSAADRSRASSVSVTSEMSYSSSSILNRPRSATVVVDQPHGDPSYDYSVTGGGEGSGGSGGGSYESGRAEALGALCRIVGSKSTDEDILPQYLARFYLVLNHGLKIKEDRVIGEAVASILQHSSNLFRINLDGVLMLMPSFVDAIEVVLVSKEFKTRPNVNRVELRRACIQILVSILAVPLHFQSISLKEFGSTSNNNTFFFIRQRLSPILFTALQTESDPFNIHLLLGGLTSLIHDSAAFEQSEQQQQHNSSIHVLPGSGYTPQHLNHHQHGLSSTSELMMSQQLDNQSCHSASSTSNSYPSMSEMSSATMDSHMEHDNTTTATGSFSDKLSITTTSVANGSLHSLINNTLHLVSNKLLGMWKNDLNSSLAALELLASLAKLRLTDQSLSESKRVVRMLCEFISVQCSRPPPAHSKDLHSGIVAAYHCCATWLLAHPYLVTSTHLSAGGSGSDYGGHHDSPLNLVLQVIELGISGSKSLTTGVGKNGVEQHSHQQIKQDKMLKPVSLRVRDAAEFLLTVLMEQVGGNTPSVDSVSCALKEEDLYPRHPASAGGATPTRHFRYFATSEGTILVGVLEHPANTLPEPTVTVLIRNQFGRQVWTSQMRHLARHKCRVTLTGNDALMTGAGNPGRPLPMHDLGMETNDEAHYFPDSVDRVRPCFADKILPSMDSLITTDDRMAAELDKLARLVDSASSSSSSTFSSDAGQRSVPMECLAPSLCNQFQSARLFLSHIGCLSVDGLQENPVARGGNYLIGLNSMKEGFAEDVAMLDQLGSRSHDTVLLFYVRSGQHDGQDILSNNSGSVSCCDANFYEFLESLGWPQSSANDQLQSDAELMKFQSFVWADGLSEMIFILPMGESHQTRSHDQKDKKMATFNQQLIADNKMFIVWLESFEDRHSFPIGDILANLHNRPVSDSSSIDHDDVNDYFFIFIHAQQSGLYRIALQGPPSKIHFATPLVDGMVVSRRVLGTLVRQTALNMAKRRRLDHDSYQLPHIRRKVKISDMTKEYRLVDCDVPTFYSNLFQPPNDQFRRPVQV